MKQPSLVELWTGLEDTSAEHQRRRRDFGREHTSRCHKHMHQKDAAEAMRETIGLIWDASNKRGVKHDETENEHLLRRM